MKFLISAKLPLIFTESGKLPVYLPDTTNGLPHERSGILNGSNCKELRRKTESQVLRYSKKSKVEWQNDHREDGHNE